MDLHTLTQMYTYTPQAAHQPNAFVGINTFLASSWQMCCPQIFFFCLRVSIDCTRPLMEMVVEGHESEEEVMGVMRPLCDFGL